MKQLYIGFALLFCITTAYTQVSVTATVGSPATYSTLKDAFDAVNAGTHKGIITISITGNTTEAASAVLNASGTGASLYTAMSIQPSGGAARTISGDVAGPLIDLNNADGVSVDGLNTGGNTLAISNINTSGTASTVRFVNDATTNDFERVTFEGAGTSVTSGTILFSTGLVTGNSNNTIGNSTITNAGSNFPVNAIYSSGTATTGLENRNNTISANYISNFFSATLATTAIFLGPGNTKWTIATNRFFQTAARTFTAANTHRIILISSGDDYNLLLNTIGYASSAPTGTYTLGGAVASRFVGIDMTAGTLTSHISGTVITNMGFVTTSNVSATSIYGVWTGIYIQAGNVDIGSITGNVIGSTTGTGSIVIAPTVNGAFATGITSTSTGTIDILFNTIASIDLAPSGANAGTLVGIQTTGASGTINVVGNNIGNSTAASMKLGTAGTTTQGGISRGILNTNAGTVNMTGNVIQNMANNGTASTSLFRGIETQAGTGSVSKNQLSNFSTGGTFASFSTQVGVGILISSTSAGIVVDSNVIYNLNITSTGTTGAVLSAIYAGVPSTSSGITNGLTITRNKIYGLTNGNAATSATAPAAVVGIYCGNNNAANPLTIANNMISIGSSQATNAVFLGIWSHYGTAQNYTARIYHNSVNIDGVVSSGAQPSFCYYRGDFSATASGVPTVDIKNNIFTNNRSGGTGKHYAIANSYPNAVSNATGWSSSASDYNVIKGFESISTYWSGDKTLSDWKLSTGADANSFVPVAVNYVNPANDLHLVPSTNSAINNMGTTLVTVTNDIDNDLRSVTSPDIGADEFTAPLPLSMLYIKAQKQGNKNLVSWKTICNAATVSFEVQRSNNTRSFSSINLFSATKDRCAQPFDIYDNTPLAGTNYYRLKMIDADGNVSYSVIVAVINKNSGFEVVGLMPSLVSNNTTLSVSSTVNTKLTLKITNINGKTMYSDIRTIEAGSNTLQLDMSRLAKGMYYLSIYTSEGESKTISFVKQ